MCLLVVFICRSGYPFHWFVFFVRMFVLLLCLRYEEELQVTLRRIDEMQSTQIIFAMVTLFPFPVVLGMLLWFKKRTVETVVDPWRVILFIYKSCSWRLLVIFFLNIFLASLAIFIAREQGGELVYSLLFWVRSFCFSTWLGFGSPIFREKCGIACLCSSLQLYCIHQLIHLFAA